MKYIVLVLVVVCNMSFAKEKSDKKTMIVFLEDDCYISEHAKNKLFADKKISKYIKDNYNLSFFTYKLGSKDSEDYMFKRGVYRTPSVLIYNSKDQAIARF